MWIYGYQFESYNACTTSMIALEEEGFAMTGGTWCLGMADWIFLLKTDENGDTIWMKTYDSFGTSWGTGVKRTEEGGFVIIGHNYTGSSEDGIIMIRTNQRGEMLWSRMYGTSNNSSEADILITEDMGYLILANGVLSSPGNTDIWLIRTDFTGDTLWTKTIDISSSDFASQILPTADGNYIIAGRGTIDSVSFTMLVKIDASGDTIWSSFSDIPSYATGICCALDGGYAVCGVVSPPDWYILKVDSLGSKEWDFVIGSDHYDYADDIIQADDGNFVVTGSFVPPDEYDADVWLVKISPEGVLVDAQDFSRPKEFTLGESYPNPFNNSTTITFTLQTAGEISLKVFDISGREIQDLGFGIWELGTLSVVWNAEDNASGVYFIRLTVDSGQSMVKKVVLMK